VPRGLISPLGQEKRPPCSLPLLDADMSLGNANWTKGLQAMSDWVWSGHLNPVAFPNNLARYFLHIPGVYEQQLNFSTTLIFDEPSFRNGIQMSGFIDRVCRELVISFIGQRRRCWYTMTHHAVLGYLTAKKHGLSDIDFENKWTNLAQYKRRNDVYSDVEIAALSFAEAFAFNPKEYSDEQYAALRQVLRVDNERRYPVEGRWLEQLKAAREARALSLARGYRTEDVELESARAAAAVTNAIPHQLLESKIDAQVVELAFLCLQFVALSGVFTALNIPDEPFLGGLMSEMVPASMIGVINDLCELGGNDLPSLIPPRVALPVNEIAAGSVSVEPSHVKGHRLPLTSFELLTGQDRDKGLTVGGVQVGTYGWSFGYHFPGNLVYCLMLHPELARYEPPYSLPVLFNEDEWRNGTQTSGYVDRVLKELVYQKVYKLTRSRYGLEHHTMFLFNSYLDYYGVGRDPRPALTEPEASAGRKQAIQCAEAAVLHVLQHDTAPPGIFNEVESSVLTWVEAFVTAPHTAYRAEVRVREALDEANRREVATGTRKLDMSPGIGEQAAFKRLLDHQIAELAMLTGHMDGLGRALTILQLHSEDAVQMVEGSLNPRTGNIRPQLNADGEVIPTGYFNTRPGLLASMRDTVGVTTKAFTANELTLNPQLNNEVKRRLNVGQRNIEIGATEAQITAEF
jgi:hypothetical protein